jgi:hypothetical protein
MFLLKELKNNHKYFTCPALYNDDKLDAISLVQSPPVLLMEMSMSEVPPRSVQQPEVVPVQKSKLQPHAVPCLNSVGVSLATFTSFTSPDNLKVLLFSYVLTLFSLVCFEEQEGGWSKRFAHLFFLPLFIELNDVCLPPKT